MLARHALAIWIFVAMVLVPMFRSNFTMVLLSMTHKFDANGTQIEQPDVGITYDKTPIII